MRADVKKEVACNVVKRIQESNLRNVRNFDGFTRSILRRIEEQGIDVGSAALTELPAEVRDAVERHVDDRVVTEADFCSVQARRAPAVMPVLCISVADCSHAPDDTEQL